MVLYRGVQLVCPVRLGTPNEGPPQEVLTALSDLSDEGTYKGVTTLVPALAVALRPFWIDRSWANLVGIHHN